jgi:hypothetical protein
MNILIKFILRQASKLRCGDGESRDYNRMYGKWIVLYPDGLKSERMCFDVAKGYRNIFGGTIKCTIGES